MEKNFFDDDDEFESFLREKADQYKLYPSDKVWNGIYNFFHTSRKWYTLTGTVLLFTTLFFIGLHITPDDNLSTDASVSNLSDNFNYFPTAGNIEPAETASLIALEKASLQKKDEFTGKPVISTRPLLSQAVAGMALHAQLSARPGDYSPGRTSLLTRQEAGSDGSATGENLSSDPSLKSSSLQKTVTGPNRSGEKNPEKAATEKNPVNWLHELAVNTLSLHPLKSHLHLQFYASPTASYRRLQHYKADVNAKSNNISPLSGDPINIDGIVDQHPAMGLEIGSALLFNASRHIVFKAGLQFNYARYAINAYQSYPEKTAITLSSVGHRAPVDTITAYSSIRNLGGRYPEALQNQYAELSLPIGAEFKLLGDKRFQVNIGGTIQPTYLLYNNTYLLTSDYGNYTKDPGLVRKWNVNTALEAYISYQMGGLRWQLGPQFRYQLLSTYNDLYPIREYLMEYGVKIGISKILK